MIGKTSTDEARLHAAIKPAIVVEQPGDRWRVTSPAPGWFRPTVRSGAVLDGNDASPGLVIGELEVLGKVYRVVVPRGAGVVALPERFAERARAAVSFGDELLTLDGSVALASVVDRRSVASAAAGAHGLVVRAPSSGRFYGRPSPHKPAFVSIGEIIESGHTICLLEVMKTFHRVSYETSTLPERARVIAILVSEEADVTAGQPLIEVEPG